MPLTVPTYTVADLDRFPDDGNRYELLEGTLLVTPPPGSAHQAVLARLAAAIQSYLAPADLAWVATPGAIQIGERTLLEPDLLVCPAMHPPGTNWKDIRGWWLAGEALSRSSRVYDREHKQGAYLEVGVREVWLVDYDSGTVFVSRSGGPSETPHREALVWHPPELPSPLVLQLGEIFRGLV